MQWRLAFDSQLTWILALCELLVHLGRIIYCLVLLTLVNCIDGLIGFNNAQKITWSWLWRRNLKRETESLLIAAQNNAIRTNCFFKVKIDYIQQNSKYRQCVNRYVIVNHIISICSTLVQNECKTRHDWVGKVMLSELCKRLKFDHSHKWYIHETQSALENKTHKIAWDLGIQTDLLILARRLDQELIDKKKLCCSSGPLIENERKQKVR